jgi:hypothetical protein
VLKNLTISAFLPQNRSKQYFLKWATREDRTPGHRGTGGNMDAIGETGKSAMAKGATPER